MTITPQLMNVISKEIRQKIETYAVGTEYNRLSRYLENVGMSVCVRGKMKTAMLDLTRLEVSLDNKGIVTETYGWG